MHCVMATVVPMSLMLALLWVCAVALPGATAWGANQIATLADFNGTDGSYPMSTLTVIESTLYGMTSQGGNSGVGVLFSLSVTGTTPTVLSSLTVVTDTGFTAPQPSPLAGEISEDGKQ